MIITDRKIFLIGFMGSGKTHWGKIWSSQTGIPFYDLDGEIEKRENLSVSEIFETKGETYFRELEDKALKLYTSMDNFIVSCGGGTPCSDNNIALIKNSGKSIYLKCQNNILFQRLLLEQEKRPLIKNFSHEELQDFIDSKVEEREKFYLQADIVLDEAMGGEISFELK